MAKNENRVYVTMKCTECGNQLRPTVKNKKYCPKCRKTVTVKEAK